MIVHDAIQGSDEWKALRAGFNTASEASAMMGVSKHTSRSELVRLKATGSEKEISAWRKRNLLDKGHGIEAKARPIAKDIAGCDLYPVTGSEGDLLASFDGIDILETIVWECKSWNESKAEQVRAGNVPEEDYWQVMQQLLVSKASRCLYMVTDGTKERTVYVWVDPDPDDFARLQAGWDQFSYDVTTYQAPMAQAAPLAVVVAGLPSINYRLDGMPEKGLQLVSNLAKFRAAAEAMVEGSDKKLETDQDFANCEAACKVYTAAEEKLKQLREQVIGEFRDVDAFTRELGEISEMIRQARLRGERQVKERKAEIRAEVKQEAERALAAHVAELNKTLGERVKLPTMQADFAGAMSKRRNIATLREAVDAELARVKVEANMLAKHMADNLALLREKAAGVEFLFRDAQELVQKDAETLNLIIDQRIREHRQEQERLEQERQKQAEQAAPQAQVVAAPPDSAIDPATSGSDRTVAAVIDHGAVVSMVEVVDKLALLKAVLAGEVPDSVLSINLDELVSVCETLGRAVPGATWYKA